MISLRGRNLAYFNVQWDTKISKTLRLEKSKTPSPGLVNIFWNPSLPNLIDVYIIHRCLR